MKWTVGTKIGIGFAIGLIILVVVGAVSYQSTTNLVETAGWVDHTYQVLGELTGVLQGLTDAETGQRGFIITADEGYLEPYHAGAAAVEQHLKDIRVLTKDNVRQQHRLDTLETMVAQRMTMLSDVLEIQKSKGYDAARQVVLSGKGKKDMDALRKVVGEMHDEEMSLLKERSDEAQAGARNAKTTILAGTSAAFVILTLAGFFIARNIAKPLQRITAIASQIAAGELNVGAMTNHRKDEVGVLAQTFNRMTVSLRGMADMAGKIAEGDLRVKIEPQSENDMLGNAFALMVQNLQRMTTQLAEGVSVLSSSANQISTSTTQLAAGAAQTATAVSEATTTVEEVRQTAQLSTQKAKIVSDAAQKTAQISQSGAKSTEENINGMNRIRQQMESIADSMVRLSEQSQTIGQIVATVEDLAAQSNLLAVNASIEAAKAGEHGKGFGVVAQEVRSLAEQSKQATNQVRNILNDIQQATSAAMMATEQGSKAVEYGVKQSGEAGQSIQALSSSVTEASHVATQIAASSQQQLVGVDQVASAMESIKQASTQNVASAKQLEAAAHNLNSLGQNLRKLVERYRV